MARNFPTSHPTRPGSSPGAGTLVVGIDSPSIEAPDGDGSVHRELLGRGIAILELLDLSGVPEGDYFMVALPLRLEGLDGSPARVILFGNGDDTP